MKKFLVLILVLLGAYFVLNQYYSGFLNKFLYKIPQKSDEIKEIVQTQISPEFPVAKTENIEPPSPKKETSVIPETKPASQPKINTPTSIIPSPNVTPVSPQISITKNGFVLSGTSCVMDYALMPQSEGNARRLIDLCENDIPKIESKFGRGPRALPYKIQFYTPAPGSQGTGGDARAYVDGGVVFLSTEYWGTKFVYDEKILAHELAHANQSFCFNTCPEYSALVVEALADYGAYVAGYINDLEKECYNFPNSRQIKVFNCTYEFLKFIESKYDSGISLKLHKAFQSGTYSENLFLQYTGKTYEQLIDECSKDSDCGGVDPL